MICGSCSVGFEDYAASSGLEDLAVTLNLAVTQYAKQYTNDATTGRASRHLHDAPWAHLSRKVGDHR